MSNSYRHLMPVYPLIAQQILDDYRIASGKCLDIGLGRYIPPTMRKRLQGKGRQRMKEKGEKGFIKGDELKELLLKTGIKKYRLISDVEGEPVHWVEIRK